MAAAVIIVYKTAILYETNNRVKLLAVENDAGSIIILQWYGRRCLLFYCKYQKLQHNKTVAVM